MILLTISLVCIFSLLSSVPTKDIVIALIVKTTNSNNWQVVKKDANEAAKELKINLTFEGPSAETAIDE